MRLHVCIPGIEQLLYPVYGQLLDFIYDLTAAVVAFSGIAFGIFVGKA